MLLERALRSQGAHSEISFCTHPQALWSSDIRGMASVLNWIWEVALCKGTPLTKLKNPTASVKWEGPVVWVTQSCPILCEPMDYPARLLCPWNFPGENTGVGCHSLLRGSYRPRDRTLFSCIAGRFFTIEVTRKAQTYLLRPLKQRLSPELQGAQVVCFGGTCVEHVLSI